MMLDPVAPEECDQRESRGDVQSDHEREIERLTVGFRVDQVVPTEPCGYENGVTEARDREHLCDPLQQAHDDRLHPGERRGMGCRRGRVDTYEHETRPGREASGRRAHHEGVTLAATSAEGGNPGASTAPGELAEQRERETGPRHADRVSEGDRAAVHVRDVLADPEVVHRCEADDGERLVDLEQVHVFHTEAGLFERLASGVGRLEHQ